MLEKRWKAVPSQLFTSNGTADGKITVADSTLFKVKHLVVLTGTSLANRDDLEVKRITDKYTIYVGPRIGNIDSRADISAFTTGLAAAIFANEQLRSKVPEQEIERHTYEEEPTVARRVILVDTLGDKVTVVEDVDGNKRLAVDASISVPPVTINYPDNIDITNFSVPVAGTEYSHTLLANSQRFALKIRDGVAALRVGFVSGDVALGPYFKINRGAVFDSGEMDLTAPFTIYFSSDVAGAIVEIIDWHF